MSKVALPAGHRLERLTKSHPRSSFASGSAPVDAWLATKALQSQSKRLSVTTALIDGTGLIAGYYTVTSEQVDFGELPAGVTKHLPHRDLTVAVIAWLGVASDRQGQGVGRTLFVHALRDCHRAGQTFAFVAVVLDCLDDRAKAFYQQFQFDELPGHPYRLVLPSAELDAMMAGGE